MIKANDILNIALKEMGVTKKDVSEKIGWVNNQLWGRMARNTLKVDELIMILDTIGMDLALVRRDTGEIMQLDKSSIRTQFIKGYGPPIMRHVNKVAYDTERASALSNNFFSDGVHEYNNGKAEELYVDSKGRYFLAEYYEKPEDRDRIIPISAELAAVFIEKNGTDINKKPVK